MIIWIATNGMVDDVAVEDMRRFETEFTAFVESAHPAVLETLREKKSIDDDLKAKMKQAVEDFKSSKWSVAKGAKA